jgi:hypothetical protein
MYEELANTYKPKEIKILLIGEAPPPNGKSYFYKVPEKYPTRKSSIEDDTSLPATIFNHYFGRRPLNEKEYEKFLCLLKQKGVFLIDIIHKPLEIQRKGKSLNIENIDILVSPQNLNDLIARIERLPITDETKIIFLLARNIYKKRLKDYLKGKLKSEPDYRAWKEFRMDSKESAII